MLKELLKPAALDPSAPRQLLDETPAVFFNEDRVYFSQDPTIEETKESVWTSNPNGSPYFDGITSLFYKTLWDLVGDLLHDVVLENIKRKITTILK